MATPSSPSQFALAVLLCIFFDTKNTLLKANHWHRHRWSRVRAAFNEYIHSCALDAVQFVMTEHPPVGKDIIATD